MIRIRTTEQNRRPVLLAVLALGIEGLLLAGSPASSIEFRDVARECGLNFVLHNDPTPEKRMIETMAGGMAVFDYDGDGRPDIFFTNGATVPSLRKSSPETWNHLYRNEGGMKFRDVTESAGVRGEGYSMGAAAADYDNDGREDLFVAGVNRNLLYHNLGNGRFEDVTEKSGIRSGEWAVAAGWFDYDNDGKLDLMVVHYSNTPLQDRFCGNREKNIRIYCHPKYFEPLPSTLYHNKGNGTFEDVSKKSGIGQYAGRGMSLAFADYDGDGFMDAFVTNDAMPNFLFHNKGNGTFEEEALLAGVALIDRGQPVSGMGVDFRDYDNDGQPDIAFTALAGETFPLFRNLGKGMFNDATYGSRMGALSTTHSGWGDGIVDFDNDGWKDVFTANSHVNDRVEAFESHVYKEPNALFANRGGKFVDATPAEFKASVKAHRGAAFGDFNGDGRIDIVVSILGEGPELWENITPGAGNWVAFRLTGVKSNRDGLGAHIRVGHQWNEMTSAISYASSSLIPIHFGIGAMQACGDVEIRWPSGRAQRLDHLDVNKLIDIKEPER